MIGYCYACDDEVELKDDGVQWICQVCGSTDVDDEDNDEWDDDDEDWLNDEQ